MCKFDPRAVRVGFVVDEVASGEIFLGKLLYSSAITIPLLPLAHPFIHISTADVLYSHKLTPSLYKTLYCDRVVVCRDDVKQNHYPLHFNQTEKIKLHSITKFLLI